MGGPWTLREEGVKGRKRGQDETKKSGSLLGGESLFLEMRWLREILETENLTSTPPGPRGTLPDALGSSVKSPVLRSVCESHQ